ncbi:alpha/beta hydrolase family protein [Cohnella pontilimi]|nr:acetylxylan esterase [Cohnella pontilimi]
MFKVSDWEESATKAREMSYIDAYPEIEEYHQNELLKYLDRRNTEYLVARKRMTKSIDTAEKAQAYAADVRERFRRCLGSLPGGRADRVYVTKTLDQGGYMIDTVYIESIPEQFLTANFYYPKGVKAPLPAFLFLCGHASEGKAAVPYVSFCVEAAMNGCCVLIFDPVGQGERRLRNTGEGTGAEDFLDPVEAHCKLDRQLSLSGGHLAQLMMKDNVKALDYLLSRSEVDPAKVAVTGNSGGGTMAAYMGAYDDRIQVVAPCCYITELRALLYRILAQDAEQCLPSFMLEGLDHSDLVTAAAPKPYLIGSAMFDFFPIDGTRDAFIEAQKMYRLLGAADRLDLHVSIAGHGMWRDMREKVIRFVLHHFHSEFPGVEIDYARLPGEEQLLCRTDQSAVPEAEKALQDWIRSRSTERGKSHLEENPTREQIRKTLTERLNITLHQPVVQTQLTDAEGEKEIILSPEPGLNIVASWKKKAEIGQNILLIVGEPDELRAAEVSAGFSAVMTVHPRGTGPSKPNARSSFGIFDPETASNYNMRMLGQTLQGMRVTDVLAAMRLAKTIPGYENAEISLYGKEEHALTALYAAALGDADGVVLDRLLYSFRLIAEHGEHAWGPAIFVLGLPERMDIGDVISALPKDRVKVHGVLDHMKKEGAYEWY